MVRTMGPASRPRVAYSSSSSLALPVAASSSSGSMRGIFVLRPSSHGARVTPSRAGRSPTIRKKVRVFPDRSAPSGDATVPSSCRRRTRGDDMSATADQFPTDTTGLPDSRPSEVVDSPSRRGLPTAHRAGPQAHRRRHRSDARLQRLDPRTDASRSAEGSEVARRHREPGRPRHDRALARPRLENRYDGTHETQALIPVGGRFTARVAFPDPGIYWYHPHVREDYGQELGLYGNVIVEPADPDYWPPVNRERRADARRHPARGRQGRAVQPHGDQLRGDGTLRRRPPDLRRAGARADGRPRRGRAVLPDQHRQHARVQGGARPARG